MSKLKSPPDKKAASYEKDHVVQCEYPKAFRRKWPRKKAVANRHQRHKGRQLLSAVPDFETAADTEIVSVTREVLRKWKGSSLPLKQHVEERVKRRQSTIGAKKQRNAGTKVQS